MGERRLSFGLRMLVAVIVLCGVNLSGAVWAQGVLENPQIGATVSGISVISGWKCTAGAITVQIDGGAPLVAAYGTLRTDTQGVCGDTNNGWGLLWNWNKYADGPHSIQVFDNGALFASATFTVKTLGHEFLNGLSGTGTIVNFNNQINVNVQWQESCQCFVIVDSTDAIRTGPPTGVDLGPSFPLCETPDSKRFAAASGAYMFAQQAGFLNHQVSLCSVSVDNPRYALMANNARSLAPGVVAPGGVIFYDVTLLNAFDGIDKFGSTDVLAHELGHQVQFANPQLAAVTSPARELQADCFAGIYLGHLIATGQFSAMDAGGISEAICGLGIGKNFAWASPGDHGTCEQRAQATFIGAIAEVNFEIHQQPYNPFQVCSF